MMCRKTVHRTNIYKTIIFEKAMFNNVEGHAAVSRK